MLHPDPDAFTAAAGPLLDADPVRHTIAHTALDSVRRGTAEPAVLLTLSRRHEVVAAALRCAGRPLCVSALPACYAAAVAAAVAEADPAPPGVTGPVPEAEAYAAAHTARTGAGTRPLMRMRLFRLVGLTPPRSVPGAARVAGLADVEVLGCWQGAFTEEAIRALDAPADPRPGLRDAMAHGAGYVLWEVDGRPVAYAAARRPMAGMSRIGPVYTPPPWRGRGYGSAVTAAAAAWAHRAGAREVVLFTDLTNPVSNAIYPRLGFRPVHDAVELAFEPAGAGAAVAKHPSVDTAG